MLAKGISKLTAYLTTAQRSSCLREIGSLGLRPHVCARSANLLQQQIRTPQPTCGAIRSVHHLSSTRLAFSSPSSSFRTTWEALGGFRARQTARNDARLLVIPSRKPPGWDGGADGGDNYHSGSSHQRQDYKFRQYQGWEQGPTPSKFSILFRESHSISTHVCQQSFGGERNAWKKKKLLPFDQMLFFVCLFAKEIHHKCMVSSWISWPCLISWAHLFGMCLDDFFVFHLCSA